MASRAWPTMHRTTRGSGDRPPTATGPRPTAALTSQLRGPHATPCPSVRPAGLCGHRDLTSRAAAAPCTHPGGLVVISAGTASPSQSTADRRRTARAGLRGRSRRSGVPGTESHDSGPGSSTDGDGMAPAHRAAAASIPAHASVRPPWWWLWHPAPFSEWQPVASLWSLEMHKHNDQQHGLQCDGIHRRRKYSECKLQQETKSSSKVRRQRKICPE
ncbi:uncharacterized protein LOC110437061 [Sorghum bicolor]|uniref:uncharacterized protein LOC110437061 n=1 Tax=Sorghum bicolor TaxID=4558 RepID=UPI00081AD51F|nr:uncharacterized protein LOC110437061 [Sorghum bicolor]|eukprot:XP_021320864.1 uncharacterized protein LOC110437061 [Sorghum bicolor]